jgi:hypothetical protein
VLDVALTILARRYIWFRPTHLAKLEQASCDMDKLEGGGGRSASGLGAMLAWI